MKTSWLVALTASALLAADPGITLIGTSVVPGDALDLSGLSGNVCQLGDNANCIPKATFGGFGSAMAYTGHNNVFLAVPDRGPFDGRTGAGGPYLDRFHFLHITVDTSAPFPNISTVLLDTRFLKNEAGQNLLGESSAFNVTNSLATLRFDPEGVAVSLQGTFFISDEYGPYIYEFDRQGHLIRRISVPAKFLISTPSGSLDSDGNSLELYPALNTSGRQANRGMEGLTLTPDGRFLVGIMQNALIQDNGLNSNTPPGRRGLNNRILKIDLQTLEMREYVYTIDTTSNGRGVNEMLAINDHEFLVLERDNRSNFPTPPNTVQAPIRKRLYKIDLNKAGLTDVSNIASLPELGTALAGLGIVPVTKTLFLDLLDPDYKVDATHTIKDVVAEKIEGIAWGPDLPDGRHVLYVTSDNDLYQGRPTQIYAFAVDGGLARITYQAQELPGPLYPPGQVKKALDDKIEVR